MHQEDGVATVNSTRDSEYGVAPALAGFGRLSRFPGFPAGPRRLAIRPGRNAVRGRVRDVFCAALLLCAPMMLSGCTSNSYAGVSFVPGAADPEIQGLAMRAQAGDKQAQLQLGIRYEEGHGVPVDLRRAERHYRMAANDSGGTIYVYSPPVGANGRGRVIPVNSGLPQTGLAEAKARLAALRSNRR